MLGFFKKIRKSLFDSGSARKYLLFAIGEITLVVLGILIALQINNWNEDRKKDQMSSIIYQELLNNIEIEMHKFKNNRKFQVK